MARRWQILKRTPEGVFRTTTDSTEGMEEIVKIAQSDENCQWIVVKDRVENRRHQIWRRSRGTVIEPWWRDDTPKPTIVFKRGRSPKTG